MSSVAVVIGALRVKVLLVFFSLSVQLLIPVFEIILGCGSYTDGSFTTAVSNSFLCP